MPNIKSAKKRVLIAKANNERNKSYRSELKTALKAANAARKSVQAVNNVRRATRMANQAKMLEYGEAGKRGFQGWKAAGVNLRNSDKKLEAAT